MKKSNIFKVAALTAVFAVAGMFANAQTTSPGSANVTQANADGPVIKVIDNKGTVKYLQSNNGITTITSTTTDNATTTTWQLGGTLTDDTYINVSSKVFGLDSLQLETGLPSAIGDTSQTHSGGTGTGWTLLVRDESTGATKKMLASNLIQAGQSLFVANIDGLVTYTLTVGLVLPTFEKVYVYRNGAKLIANVDYTISGNVVTLHPSNANENFTIYKNDRIEVHYIK